MAVGNVLGAIVGVAWFSRGTWKSTYIDESDAEPVAEEPAG